MPGMQPRPQGPQQGIQSLTPNLMQMDIQQLQSELMNPGSSIPKFALLSTIDRKIKERQAMQAAQGMSAQQQNAMQPPGSVAEQVLAAAQQVPEADATQTLRAKAQQLMNSGRLAEASYVLDQIKEQEAKEFTQQRYAGGGIVAFAGGDAVWKKRLIEQGVPEFFINRMEAKGVPPETIETEARRSGYMPAQTAPVAEPTPYVPPEQRSVGERISDSLAKLRASSDPSMSVNQRLAAASGAAPAAEPPVELAPPSTTPQATPPREAYRPSMNYGERYVPPVEPPAFAPDTRTKPTARPASGIATAQPQPAAATPQSDFFTDFLKRQQSQQEERQKQLDALLGRETALSGERKAEIERRETARKGEMTEAEKARDDALRRATGFGARELFEMAASIDPRRGYVMGSLGKGLAGITGRQAKEQEDARKTFLERSKVLRTEENLLREAELARQGRDIEAQRGNFEAANRLQDQYQALLREVEKVRYDRQQDVIKGGLEERRVKAVESQARTQAAQAGKPAAEIQLMEWMRNPENRKLYDEIQSAKRAEERRLKLRELYDKRPLGSPEMTFEDFMIEFERSAGKSAGAGSAPPAGAVRLKGQ